MYFSKFESHALFSVPATPLSIDPKVLNQHISGVTKGVGLPESRDLVEVNFLYKVSKFGGCS